MASSSSTPKRPKVSQGKIVQSMMHYLGRIQERVEEKMSNMQIVPPEMEAIQSSIKVIYDAVLMFNNPEGDASFLQTLWMIGQSSFEEWKEAGFATEL